MLPCSRGCPGDFVWRYLCTPFLGSYSFFSLSLISSLLSLAPWTTWLAWHRYFLNEVFSRFLCGSLSLPWRSCHICLLHILFHYCLTSPPQPQGPILVPRTFLLINVTPKGEFPIGFLSLMDAAILLPLYFKERERGGGRDYTRVFVLPWLGFRSSTVYLDQTLGLCMVRNSFLKTTVKRQRKKTHF